MDAIFLRDSREPLVGVTNICEGARIVSFDLGGVARSLESHRVLAIVRDGPLGQEMDHAQKRMSRGDYVVADRLLSAMASRPDMPAWFAAYATFHKANARALRARLEGQGHDEALAALVKWRDAHEDHFFAPQATIAAGEAALACDRLDTARAEFSRLQEGTPPFRLLARWGLACVELRKNPATALTAFEKLEPEALRDPWGIEAAMRARLGRCEALVKLGRAREAGDLLHEVINNEGWTASPLLTKALNMLAEIYADVAGRLPDGSPKPEAVVAALPLWFRAVRYSRSDPIERARSLGGAVRGCAILGKQEIGALMKTELTRRFPTALHAQGV